MPAAHRMKFSLLNTLRAGPPPPKVALLPDALFFTRAVPMAAGATSTEAAAQVELALEAAAPFPVAQLYYGWFWRPGADHAFVFASYRRRFTAEQAAAWDGAQLVLPAFAALLGAKVEPATTVVLASSEGLTAVHWDAGPVPARVLFHPLLPEATDDDRARVREELIRAIGGSKTVVDLAAPPAADPSLNDRQIIFRSGDFVSRLPAVVAAALDVRDKDDLAALRRARRRDVILWRVALGCAAALVLFAVGDIARFGGLQWQRVRVAKLAAQRLRVETIMTSDAIAKRIEELCTKRLLPMEMLTQLSGVNRETMPADLFFTRMLADSKNGLYTLRLEGQTNNSGQMSLYKSALEKLPACEKVELQPGVTRGDTATFLLIVTFKPEALQPLQPLPAS
jgi:hypothetical protein